MNKRWGLIFVALALALSTLACALPFNLPFELPNLPFLGGSGLPEGITLGETYRSEGGGFSISKVNGYSFSTETAGVQMVAPNASTASGPAVYAYGEILSTAQTNQQALEKMKSTASKDAKFTDEKEITLSGVKGLQAAISGASGGVATKGKLAVAMFTPNQSFVLMVGAPEKQWDEGVSVLYDRLLESVTLFKASATPIAPLAATAALKTPTKPAATLPPFASPTITLGGTYRSEGGGFSISRVNGYELSTGTMSIHMWAPNSTTTTGVHVNASGDILGSAQTNQQILRYLQSSASKDAKFTDEKEITISGVKGLQVEIAGVSGGVATKGRFAVAMFSPTQSFTLMVGASEKQWDEGVNALYDALLASVSLFKATNPFTPSPTTALKTATKSSVPDVGFYCTMNKDGKDSWYSSIEVDTYSTAAEYVLGFNTTDQTQKVTLYLPKNLSLKMYPLIDFNPSALNKAPSASIFYTPSNYYAKTGSFLIITELANNAITGAVTIMAEKEGDPGKMVNAMCTFSKVVLK